MKTVITTGAWADNIIDVHGEVGRDWLDQLSGTISACADKWSLEFLPPFKELNYNYVTPATTAEGMPVVLKSGVPSEELTSEIEALREFDGNGSSRLLAADTDLGVMLLERLQPGTFLSDIDDDDEITSSAVSVMHKLCAPAPTDHHFTLVSDWVKSTFRKVQAHFGQDYGPLPCDMIDTAQNLFAEILDPLKEQTLIHGDFHPQNILRSERDSWLTIDPKGVVGDPLYDAAVFVCEPPRQPTELDQKQFLARRIDQLAEALAVDRRIIAKWCLSHSVLSGCWALGDHGDGWKPAFARARVLESLQNR